MDDVEYYRVQDELTRQAMEWRAKGNALKGSKLEQLGADLSDERERYLKIYYKACTETFNNCSFE